MGTVYLKNGDYVLASTINLTPAFDSELGQPAMVSFITATGECIKSGQPVHKDEEDKPEQHHIIPWENILRIEMPLEKKED